MRLSQSLRADSLTTSLTVQSYEEHAALANKTAENTLFRPLFLPLFFAQKSAQEKTAHKKITPCVHETDIRTSDFGRFGDFYFPRTIHKYNIIIYYYIIFELFYTILFFLHRPSPFPLKF